MKRRTLLTAVSSTAAVALAGCSSGGDSSGSNNGNNDSSSGTTEAEEWTQLNLSQEVTFDFPEGERITYESNPPAKVEDLAAYKRGDVIEVRGTLIVSEQIRRVVEFEAVLKAGGEEVGNPETTIQRPGPNEDHTFSTQLSGSGVDSVDSLTLYVNGPEPQT
ncbi:hypothetical protein ABSL23_15860 (plasmid) [Halobacterium sp. NMX12-1]|uniref:Uncharacterized protein n=1 Tax=Halobacterium sp. NMX12-1 TaxID=3166650 RepID=A0AAU8CIQ4_9EURY